ncbi:uncharacterized protein LOC112170899 [Rosa chinensis]|uniref:uncharacterized protein LOC112170899 n=1 Tax=Rosa chinensis TaxID=74649 RepID=UPI000D090E05|nr:uncharacterized protein LOC112170899 [Rosa chinensis]
MDKSWMKADRRSLQFQLGLEEFLKFASDNARDTNKICCPCLKCHNTDFGGIGLIKDHIFFNGIDVSYKHWKWHGEPSTSALHALRGDSETVEMNPDSGIQEDDVGLEGSEDEEISEDSNEFMQFVEDGDKPLYPGCTKTTKLNGLIQTFNMKAKHGMIDACYSDMLIMIGLLLLEGNDLPGSTYEAKRTLSALGMGYEKIHACPNDCILYRLQHADATSCPTCGESRWKLGKDKSEKEGVPGKVLWYFPLIPRFKRMFQSTVSAKELTWHANDRKKDGMMRHPGDSPTWKMIDTKWPDFGLENRNLRLALSSDGFNPHSSLSSKYSYWLVILITYNIPPWSMMLTMLISGPKQPENDIDVYLQPLVDDLKVLWDGVERVYDAVRGEYFKLKAILLWTINDFPAYGNLSGSIVKGYNACPICVDQTRPYRLKNSKKMAFMRHRRWLPRHHPYRNQAAAFDNTIEEGKTPTPLTGEEVLTRVQGLNRPFGKKNPPPPYKGHEDENRPCWKKRSVFFELDYWEHLPVRHNLDVMHIEKNCCDAILGTLLNISGKTKDGAVARLDMVEMGIQTDLKPTTAAKRDKLPLGSWNLFLDERKIVCSSFFNMTVPVQFSSNVRNLVSMEDLRLAGLKSHDCHTIMQLLLPVALRSVLEKPVRYAIIRFCLFFKAICSKVIDVSKLQQMQADLVDTVCLLEKFFPPSFFDIMIHLTIHLVREVELCGLVFFRWMYPFERYMKVFKGYVKNRQFPEGCIAECYIVEEAVEFCSERMLPREAATIGIPSRTKLGLLNGCKPLSGATIITVDRKQLDMAHLCRAYGIPKVEFSKVVNEMRFADNDVPETIRWLAGGPKKEVPTFGGYHVNGVDFNTSERDKVRSVQNSGVFLVADAMQVASARDKNPKTDDMDFYGRIQQIWEVDYYKFRIPVFMYFLHTRPLDDQWSVVVRCSERDYQGGCNDEELEDIELEQHPFIPTMPSIETFDDVVGDLPSSYIRDGNKGIWVENEDGRRV